MFAIGWQQVQAVGLSGVMVRHDRFDCWCHIDEWIYGIKPSVTGHLTNGLFDFFLLWICMLVNVCSAQKCIIYKIYDYEKITFRWGSLCI